MNFFSGFKNRITKWTPKTMNSKRSSSIRTLIGLAGLGLSVLGLSAVLTPAAAQFQDNPIAKAIQNLTPQILAQKENPGLAPVKVAGQTRDLALPLVSVGSNVGCACAN